jgi:hypothetical protein
MHEKDFGLLAQVLPHMAARWRLPSDLEILAELPDGMIDLDVVAGTARHASAGPVPLRLAAELRAGLADQLARRGIAASEVRSALVTLAMDTGAVLTDKARIVHFDFRIASRLDTESGVFSASQTEDHVWHERGG